MSKKAKPCTLKKSLIGTGLLVLIGALIALITFSALYYDNYYNTLTCDIYQVTPIESANDYRVYWFFQYSYRGQGCEESKVYTVDDYSYYVVVESHDRISNLTNATCYAEKQTDQCDVYMNAPTSTGFIMGMLLGSPLLLVAFCALGWFIAFAFCD